MQRHKVQGFFIGMTAGIFVLIVLILLALLGDTTQDAIEKRTKCMMLFWSGSAYLARSSIAQNIGERDYLIEVF